MKQEPYSTDQAGIKLTILMTLPDKSLKNLPSHKPVLLSGTYELYILIKHHVLFWCTYTLYNFTNDKCIYLPKYSSPLWWKYSQSFPLAFWHGQSFPTVVSHRRMTALCALAYQKKRSQPPNCFLSLFPRCWQTQFSLNCYKTNFQNSTLPFWLPFFLYFLCFPLSLPPFSLTLLSFFFRNTLVQ